MAKTLASQAKNGGSIPPARSTEDYQACSVPQCGQSTDVVTLALNAYPHMQE
jgi:hypothetical protein